MNFLYLLTSHERKISVLLMIMILMMSILDTIGVASIIPFITVLTNPDLVETNNFLNYMFQFSKKYGVEQLTAAQMGGLECGKCHY